MADRASLSTQPLFMREFLFATIGVDTPSS